MDFIKVLFRTNNRTGCRFLIVDALNRPKTLHYYEKNGFRYLIDDERLEAKYMGIVKTNYVREAVMAPWHNLYLGISICLL